MRHSDIWKAIDLLAHRNNLSPSGLAKAAGLDPTAFNKSKRTAPDGRPRWLSTESLARALDAVEASLEEFAAMAEGRQGQTTPLLGFAKAGNDGYFDEAGFPAGDGWETARFPGLSTDQIYALEITSDAMAPVYRRGDRIVVSPGAPVRKGDRAVAKTRRGDVLVRALGRSSERMVELLSINSDYPAAEIARADLAWIARILWASQ